jgi:adenylosuccinate synthase
MRKLLQFDQLHDLGSLPLQVHQYIEYIEKATGLPITIVSVGPDRKQTLLRQPVLK